MLHTRLCEALGIEVPIVVAPMGLVTGPELAAAVSNAGGLGILSFSGNPPPVLRQQIHQVRELTDKPFGVNLLLHFPVEEHVDVCIDERVPVLSFYWGDPAPYVGRAHDAGMVVFDQVGSVAAATRSVKAGVDVIVAQGEEAGGHLAGRVATSVLVPRIVDAVAPVPVVAAGGIADARGVVAALALGAEAVQMGTRFLATREARAHPAYKERVLAATEEDTVRTTLFGHGWPNAPHRAIRTPFVEEWLSDEARGSESRPDEPILGHTTIAGRAVPIPRFSTLPPSADVTGDVESMALLAGESAGLVDRIEPAAAVVRELVAGAARIIADRLAGLGGDALREERERVVRLHMESENVHDFDTVIGTFSHPRYELVATDRVHDGEREVREYFRESRSAFPDQRNELISLRHADDAVVVEFWLLGTHEGPLLGIPPTGRAFRCRMTAFFLFEGAKLVCERVYFDSGTILRQLTG